MDIKLGLDIHTGSGLNKVNDQENDQSKQDNRSKNNGKDQNAHVGGGAVDPIGHDVNRVHCSVWLRCSHRILVAVASLGVLWCSDRDLLKASQEVVCADEAHPGGLSYGIR